MNNIISAEFSRLFKSRIFKIALIAAAVVSVSFPIYEMILEISWRSSAPSGMEVGSSFYEYGFQYCFFVTAPLGFILAVMISIFVGHEFSNSTISNKIISGHSRPSIYLAYFAACYLGGIIIYFSSVVLNMLIQFICFWIISPLYLKRVITTAEEVFNHDSMSYEEGTIYFYFISDWGVVIRAFIVVIFLIAVFCALFTFIVMIAQSKPRSVIICLVAAIAISSWGEIVSAKVMPVSYDMIYDGNDSIVDIYEKEESLRGEALSGADKAITLFIDDALPYTQGLALNDSYFPKRGFKFILCDIGIVSLLTAAGILLFTKRDLRSGVKSD